MVEIIGNVNSVVTVITVTFEKHIAKTEPSELQPSLRQSQKLAEAVILGHLVYPCQSEIVF
jgi:hypothetical protein